MNKNGREEKEKDRESRRRNYRKSHVVWAINDLISIRTGHRSTSNVGRKQCCHQILSAANVCGCSHLLQGLLHLYIQVCFLRKDGRKSHLVWAGDQ